MGRSRGERRMTFDSRMWLRGAASSDESLEGGFSPLTTAINPFEVPGLIKAGLNNISTASNGVSASETMFGSAFKDANSGTALSMFATADSGLVGRFYTVNYTTGAVTLAATDSTRQYNIGISDMVKFQGEIYTTSNQNVGKSNLDFSTNDFTWWTGTKGKAALTSGEFHGLFVHDDELYILDGRYIHKYDGTTISTNALDVGASMHITAACVHDGVIWFAVGPMVQGEYNIFTRGCFLRSWDGLQVSFDDDIPVTQPIVDLFSSNGTLFASTAFNLNIFTGSGIAPIRPLGIPIRKHTRAIIDDNIYYVDLHTKDGTDFYHIMCYGTPIAGKARVFYPVYALVSTSYFGLCAQVLNRLMLFDNRDVKILSPRAGGLANSIFRDIKRPLDTYGLIRFIEVETEPLTSGGSFDISYVNSQGNTIAVGTHSTVGKSVQGFDVHSEVPTFIFQFSIIINGTNGLRRVHVEYDPTEKKGV